MHKRILLISLLLLCRYGWSQTALLDSLQKNINQATTDSGRIWNTMSYALHLAKMDFKAAVQKMRAAGEEAKGLGEDYLHARSFQMLSSVYYNSGDYINAIAFNEPAEKILLGLREDRDTQFGLAAVYNDLGASYSLINEMEKAQEYYTRSVALFEKVKDSGALILTHFNIAFIYIDIQEWEKALFYFEKGMRYKSIPGDYEIKIQLFSRKAAMHFRLNQIQAGKKLLDSCSKFLLAHAIEDQTWNYYNNALGEYYYATQNGKQALEHFKTAQQYGLKWNDPYYIADDNWEIGRTFLLLNQPDSAGKYLQAALETANRYNYLPKVRFILNDWCRYYDRIENYKKANELRAMLLRFTDSVVTVQNHNRILLYDARYNSQQKEAQIGQLEKDKNIRDLQIKQKDILNFILLGCAVAAIILSILVFRNYRQQRKLQLLRISELEAQQQLAATEAVLKGEEQERTRLAKDLHDGLGGLLSGIKYSFQTMKGNLIMTPENHQAFERGLAMLDNSIQEMRRVAHNMMPEALVKFGLDTALKDFCTDINQSGVLRVQYQSFGLENPSINQTAAITIYRIVQELINNTIKHAGAGSAVVQITKTGNQLAVTVEDDGKGFDTSVLSQPRGIGWSNIQNRVEFLKGNVDLKSEQGKGTSVYITFEADKA